VDDYESQNDTWRSRRSRSKSPPPKWIDKLLPSLPSTDEEDGAVDVLRKEARRIHREQKKREENGKPGRKKARPFPLKPTDESDEDSRVSMHVSTSYDLYSTAQS
jgi:hypothetical protein